MRCARRYALVCLLILGMGLTIGCSEDSTAPDDDNPPPPTGEHLWSQGFGDGSEQSAWAVAADASGNAIVAGAFEGTVNFGGGDLASSGGADVFLAKFGPGGAHVWSKGFDGFDYQEAHAVAVDASGNVIVAGRFFDAVDFGGGDLTSAGEDDIFVAKFGPDGGHVWSRGFGDGDTQRAYGVAVDASGNVIVTGGFYGTVNFGGDELTSAGEHDIFVAKFGPGGTHLWSKRFGNGSWQWGEDLAVDASGNVIVTGPNSENVDFGGGELQSGGWADIFVAKLGPGGTHLWSRLFGDAEYQQGNAVAVDISGNVVIAGTFKGSVDFGGGDLITDASDDAEIFVAKLGPDGTHRWSKGIGDLVPQIAEDVAVDFSGNVIVTGRFMGTADFGGGNLTSAGNYDAFVAKFGPGGSHVWSKHFGDNSEQQADAVCVDPRGNVVIAGGFRGTLNCGGADITTPGDLNIFVARFER